MVKDKGVGIARVRGINQARFSFFSYRIGWYFDTGVIISAYAFGGTPEKAVKKAFSEAVIYLTPTF